MLFSRQLTTLILDRRKTQTSRIVKPGEGGALPRCYYRADHDYALHRPMRLDEANELQAAIIQGRRRGRPPKKEVGRIRIATIERSELGEITFDFAKAEGFTSPAAFKAYWVGLHDRRWLRGVVSWCPACLLDPDCPADTLPPCSACDGTDEITLVPTDEQRVARFDEHWAGVEVWVITFSVAPTTLYLSEQAGSAGDYVTSERDERGRQIAMTSTLTGWAPSQVVGGEIVTPSSVTGTVAHRVPEEAVHPDVIDSWAKDAERAEPTTTHGRIKAGIAGRQERAVDQRALDRGLLDAEDRLKRARAAAALSHIDISSERRALHHARERSLSAETLETRLRSIEIKAYREETRDAA